MEKPLKIFRNLYDVMETLPPDKWCFYWGYLLKYHFKGVEPKIQDPMEIAFWNSLKSLIEIAQSDRRSITSAANGKKHTSRNSEQEENRIGREENRI